MPALTASQSFTLTVTPVPDVSGSMTVAANLSGIASSYSANTYGRTLSLQGLTVDEVVVNNGEEICLGTSSGSCDVATWVQTTGYTTTGSAPTVSFSGTYKLKSGVGGAQAFSLTPSCSTTTNYYYSVRVTNAYGKVSNVVSTPAWFFWEPTCLGTGLAQWLDASETSTISQSATKVTAWADKSTNARNIAQATPANQPTYSATAMGTLPGITFNGTSSTLTRAGFAYGLASSSYFTVIKGAAATSNRYIFSEGASVSANNYYSPLVTSTTSKVTGRIATTAATVLSLPVTSTIFLDNTIRFVQAEDTSTNYFTYSNGVAQTQGATVYARGAGTYDYYCLGARYRTAAAASWFSGSIGEFIITNGILSATDRTKLEGYSAHKWGVSSSLPVLHTYLTTPP
jgi:hypothetical protein